MIGIIDRMRQEHAAHVREQQARKAEEHRHREHLRQEHLRQQHAKVEAERRREASAKAAQDKARNERLSFERQRNDEAFRKRVAEEKERLDREAALNVRKIGDGADPRRPGYVEKDRQGRPPRPGEAWVERREVAGRIVKVNHAAEAPPAPPKRRRP